MSDNEATRSNARIATTDTMGRDEVWLILKALEDKWRPLGCLLDAITALYAERDSLLTVREVLKRECAALKAERSELIDDVESMQRTNNDLAAENERLRAALLPLANLDLRGSGFDQRPDDQIVYARDTTKITVGDVLRARAALKGDSHD